MLKTILMDTAALLIGYALGNIQTAILISKDIYKDDVRMHGSGNAGTNNMLRVFGKKAGVFTFIGDCFKGIAAVLLGRLLGGEIGGYICGLGAVLGHDFPVVYKFKGGKGVATSLGIAWVCFPFLAALTTVIGFGIIWMTQMVSVGSLLGMTFFAFGVLLRHEDNLPAIIFFLIIWALIIYRHTDNIKRLRKGEENRLFPHGKKDKSINK